jgi:hypothetical protein
MLLRKFDYYGQCILAVMMFISIPILFFYGFLAGLFVLGCWQLLSAAANTYTFLLHGRSRLICNYWRWTGIVMAFLFLCIPLSKVFNPDDVQVLGVIAIIASIPLAWYYLRIYYRLIQFMKAKTELGALIRSKH